MSCSNRRSLSVSTGAPPPGGRPGLCGHTARSRFVATPSSPARPRLVATLVDVAILDCHFDGAADKAADPGGAGIGPAERAIGLVAFLGGRRPLIQLGGGDAQLHH